MVAEDVGYLFFFFTAPPKKEILGPHRIVRGSSEERGRSEGLRPSVGCQVEAITG